MGHQHPTYNSTAHRGCSTVSGSPHSARRVGRSQGPDVLSRAVGLTLLACLVPSDDPSRPGQDRLCWFIQKRAEQESCIRRLQARETTCIPLVKRTPIALEIDCRAFTNRVTTDSVGEPGILRHPVAAERNPSIRTGPQRSPHLSFQLPLQLSEEALVGALGDDLLWRTLDHPRLLQVQGVEAQRIFGSYSRHLPYGSSCTVWSV